ncbi:peroxide stress protein YaaA [Goodfellowiella coeruleoviolacea]|uniref:Peroxide stress protein YaaA n=1 Tax=Goodfellowiella coeruleoviolacea TaxID=334858 RepID=A0AAE3GLJ9_9PSEU|nr:peroxide stress protein YaaA [Goodfellowiella coeruleoviolacea]MCP2169634.1 hypothetical protein [Goodfellowiella coeruleoviolacea]
MLVLLPPSETKAPGGEAPPLDLAALSFPDLTPVRTRLVTALTELAEDVPASLAALGLSERQAGEVERNARLLTAPTAPALARYTGVLYDALDVATLSTAALARAKHRLAVASALFGLVRGADLIPAYRLSAGSALPGIGPLRSLWRPALEPIVSTVDELVIDLRSGAYAGLARVPSAVLVRVVSVDGAGRRKAVSHHNKAHKGRLARALATSAREPATVSGVLRVATAAGLRLDHVDANTLELVVPA